MLQSPAKHSCYPTGFPRTNLFPLPNHQLRPPAAGTQELPLQPLKFAPCPAPPPRCHCHLLVVHQGHSPQWLEVACSLLATPVVPPVKDCQFPPPQPRSHCGPLLIPSCITILSSLPAGECPDPTADTYLGPGPRSSPGAHGARGRVEVPE